MNKRYNCGELLSPALQALIEKKVDRLEKKFDLEDANIDISMSKDGKEYVLKMQLASKKHNVIAKAVNGDMYKNIDECIDKLSSQIVHK